MVLLIACIALALSCFCKNPYDYEPYDPTKPDPPAAPVQLDPPDGKLILNYAYPQDVVMKWQRVSGTAYYQVEVYQSSKPAPESLYAIGDKVYSTETAVTFNRHGCYWWRVRAYSPNWKWFTDWSPLWMFILPNPTS